MTVSTTTIKNSYSGNGSATAFNYTFKIFASSELKVYIRTTATGAETLKTVTTHYTVSGIGDTGGGTVTFTSGNVPTSAEQVILVRDTPLTQSTDYVENDPFPASSHEDALDKLTHQMQEQQEELDRSFKVSKTVTDLTSSEVVDDAATRASKLLGFSSDGASFAYYSNPDVDAEVTAIAGLTSAANKIIRYTGSGTADLIDFLDQDDMDSNSASAVASQQSVKAYVDSGTATLTNKTLTAPKFADGGFIADANGNELIKLETTSSAVNELSVTNAAAGNAITLSATGGDTNIDIDLTPKGSGEINIAAGNLNYAGTAVTATGAELNILDGVTATAAEINLIDGGTSRGTTAVASGDGILINDAGTMRMTNVDTVSTYFSSHNVGGSNIVTTGALNSGSITSGFGTIDTGSSAITTTGLISGGSLDIDDVLINGTTIGHTDDTDLITLADGVVTVAGELDATTLDISGNADIDGTLEADAITVDGTALAEYISDTAGAMFSSNTETGLSATYQDGDNTIDLEIAAAQTTITSLLATDIKIGEDDQTKIDFETADEIHFYSANAERVRILSDGKVGIGTTAPVSNITSEGDISIGSTVDSDNGDLGEINFWNRTNAGSGSGTSFVNDVASIQGQMVGTGNNSGGDLHFYTKADGGSKTEALTITGDGNVGINVDPTIDSSLASLSIGGKVLHVHDTSGASLKLSDADSGANRGLGFASVGTDSAIVNCEAGDMRFGTGNSEKMRIDHSVSGLVIGTTTADCLLHVHSTAATTAKVKTTATNSYAELIFQDGNAGYAWQTRSDNAQSTGTGSFLINDRDTGTFPVVIKEGNATNTLVLSGSKVYGTSQILQFPPHTPIANSTGSEVSYYQNGALTSTDASLHNTPLAHALTVNEMRCYVNSRLTGGGARVYVVKNGTAITGTNKEIDVTTSADAFHANAVATDFDAGDRIGIKIILEDGATAAWYHVTLLCTLTE